VACPKRNETAVFNPRFCERFAMGIAGSRSGPGAAIGRPFYVSEPRARQRRGAESAIPERGSRGDGMARARGPLFNDARQKCTRFETAARDIIRGAPQAKVGGRESRRKDVYVQMQPILVDDLR
jgi:hypothetical protein